MTGHKHSVSVAGVIIDDDGRILLTQRMDNGRWEPPGGILEHGERIEDGVRREVKEETGLDVTPVRLTGVYKNLPRDIVALVFRCDVIDGALAANSEVKAFYWASRDEVSKMVPEAFAVRVFDACQCEEQVPVREHDGVKLI